MKQTIVRWGGPKEDFERLVSRAYCLLKMWEPGVNLARCVDHALGAPEVLKVKVKGLINEGVSVPLPEAVIPDEVIFMALIWGNARNNFENSVAAFKGVIIKDAFDEIVKTAQENYCLDARYIVTFEDGSRFDDTKGYLTKEENGE